MDVWPDDWTKIDAYVRPLPLVKRVQIVPTGADLARQIFVLTQCDLRDRLTGLQQRPAL